MADVSYFSIFANIFSYSLFFSSLLTIQPIFRQIISTRENQRLHIQSLLQILDLYVTLVDVVFSRNTFGLANKI